MGPPSDGHDAKPFLRTRRFQLRWFKNCRIGTIPNLIFLEHIYVVFRIQYSRHFWSPKNNNLRSNALTPNLTAGLKDLRIKITTFCKLRGQYNLNLDQSRISRTPCPPIGAANAVTGGPKLQSRHHLAPQRKSRSPKLKYEALEISKVRGSFERKVLTHCTFFGPF